MKHVKSNGILIVKDNTTVGVGAGQSRVDSVDIAMKKSGESIKDSILCSDAFSLLEIALIKLLEVE